MQYTYVRTQSILRNAGYTPKFEEIDCTKLMDKIPKESIDTTITSPPYNIGKEYENTRHNLGFIALDYICNKYGVKIDKK